jgi:hypothetical protein
MQYIFAIICYTIFFVRFEVLTDDCMMFVVPTSLTVVEVSGFGTGYELSKN